MIPAALIWTKILAPALSAEARSLAVPSTLVRKNGSRGPANRNNAAVCTTASSAGNELLENPFDSRPVATALRDRDLPAAQKIAENLLRVDKARPAWVDPQPADLQSFPALREWYHRVMRLYLPEAEFRQMQATLPDGRPSSESRAPDWVGSAIMAGRKSFHHIGVPALYIGAEDNVPADYDKNDPEARADAEAYIAYQHGWIERRTVRFMSDAPNGRLVILKGASHMVFASNPQDVLRESLSFADSLPAPR